MDTEKRKKMKVCDRCKKELDTAEETSLAGEKFELCNACAGYISNHIKTFKAPKGAMASLFGK